MPTERSSWVALAIGVTRLSRVEIRAALERSGFADVPNAGSMVLSVLRSGPTSVGQLADRLQRPKQAISRIVDSLVERGYVVRHDDPGDRRRLVLQLTARGQEAAKVVTTVVVSLDRRFEAELRAAGLDPGQFQPLQLAMGKLLADP